MAGYAVYHLLKNGGNVINVECWAWMTAQAQKCAPGSAMPGAMDICRPNAVALLMAHLPLHCTRDQSSDSTSALQAPVRNP